MATHITRNILAKHPGRLFSNRNDVIHNLLLTRDVHNLDTIFDDTCFIRSIDIDPTGSFVLYCEDSGQCGVFLIKDANIGSLETAGRVDLDAWRLRRVQWSPDANEPCSYVLGHRSLSILDDLRPLEQFKFNNDPYWSDWNANDIKMIAVSCNNSTVSLVDIASGGSLQTIILAPISGLRNLIATRCCWSKQDSYCLAVGDNDGFIHIYDIRHSTRAVSIAGENIGEEFGEINCMSFNEDHSAIITTHGPKNRPIQWDFKRCSLKPNPGRFRCRELEVDASKLKDEQDAPRRLRKSRSRPRVQRQRNILSNAIVPKFFRGSQFYLTSRHLYCPANYNSCEATDLNVYDLKSGLLFKTLSTEMFSRGVYCVVGLLPDSMVLYTGGSLGLRIWTFDEDHERQVLERVAKYHESDWSSDSD